MTVTGPVPRLQLSGPAFDVVRLAAGARATREVLEELAAAGALVRGERGRLHVDPALGVALRAWATGPVAVDVLALASAGSRHLRLVLDPPMAVGVTVDAPTGGVPWVHVCVPGIAGALREVLDQLRPGAGSGGRVVWRVSAPGRGWLAATPEVAGEGAADGALRADLARAVLAALELAAAGAS